MAIIGLKKKFAIEYEKSLEYQDGHYGHFSFWAQEQRIGNWEDLCDLKGVLHWCRHFVSSDIDRYEPTLESLSKEEMFAAIYDSTMVYKVTNLQPKANVKNAFSRFHISYLGMSSFADYFGILLVELTNAERLIWANLQTNIIYEAIFPKNTVNEVIQEFSRGRL